MARAAAAVAPSRTNVRREIGLVSSVIARDPVGAGISKLGGGGRAPQWLWAASSPAPIDLRRADGPRGLGELVTWVCGECYCKFKIARAELQWLNYNG